MAFSCSQCIALNIFNSVNNQQPLCKIAHAKVWLNRKNHSLRAGVSFLRPAGQIRPAKTFHPVQEDISSKMRKKCFHETFVDLVANVTYPKTITLSKMSAPRTIV